MKLLTAALVILFFIMIFLTIAIFVDVMLDNAFSDYLGIIVRKKLGIKKEDKWK